MASPIIPSDLTCDDPTWSDEYKRPASMLRPEQRLMQAMLEDAIRCLSYPERGQGPQPCERRIVEAWIDSPSIADLFDFRVVCMMLDLGPREAAAGMRRMAATLVGGTRTRGLRVRYFCAANMRIEADR